MARFVEFYPFTRCALVAVLSRLIFNRLSLLFTLVSGFCITCLVICLHLHQYVPLDCGLIPSFLYSSNYFYFCVYRFLTFKFQYFGGENKMFALGVADFICVLFYSLYHVLVVRASILTMFDFTLLLILSLSIRVPLISNWFHFSLPIVFAFAILL